MSRREKRRDLPFRREQDVYMASNKEEAAGAAWEGADLERTIVGEDPTSASLEDARHWVAVYSHLVQLEQELFDVLARMIPQMPADAKREAEETNLPVLASQLERFRHRLDFWSKRRRELEARRRRQ
jgi:hypothetical protein